VQALPAAAQRIPAPGRGGDSEGIDPGATMASRGTMLLGLLATAAGHGRHAGSPHVDLPAGSACSAALQSVCSTDAAPKSTHSPFATTTCGVCAGRNQHDLRAAGCSHEDIQAYCAGAVSVTLTTTDQSSLFAPQPSIPLGVAPSAPTIRIDGAAGGSYQTMVGFGAAITDASAYVLHTAENYEELMMLLFGSRDHGGISLGMLRVPMGVSDFSMSYASGNITYDDTPGDWALEHFSTAVDDAHTIPVLRRARSLNPNVKVVASPWTAPLWLKTGRQAPPVIGEGSLLDTDQAYETYANYFVKFVQEYERKGVRVDYVTLQNEPSHGGCGTMPCMLLPEHQEAKLAIKVGQKFKMAGLDVRILAYDHNWGKQGGVPISGPAYPTAMLNDPAVNQWLGGVAWHCYGGSEAVQTPVHELDPSKEVHMTECSGGGWSGPWGSNFVSNMQRLFVGGANNWGQSTLLWNMALDEHAGPRCLGGACCTDCRGVLTVPSNATSMADITKNVEFYSLAHFSYFIPQGSVRVKSQRAPQGGELTRSGSSQCSAYCNASSAACDWTKQYSCPWAKTPGTKGRAGDDGSVGYRCCCADRTGTSDPCGGNGTAPAPGNGASVQFVAFVTPPPASETILQVLNPSSEPQKVAVVVENGKLGFEYTLEPGLATFAWK
jgi:glucosylceramidase